MKKIKKIADDDFAFDRNDEYDYEKNEKIIDEIIEEEEKEYKETEEVDNDLEIVDEEEDTDEEKLIEKLKKEGKTYNSNYNYDEIDIKMENFPELAKKYHNAINAGVRRVQKMYGKHSSLDENDLYQEGMIALFKSIEKFNPERGVFFGYYLKAAINNSLKTHCRNFLPHKYVKDIEKTELEGKQKFKRIAIDVDTLDNGNSYLL